MDTSEYGPFAQIVAFAFALFAMFSVLLLKGIGRINNWTWLIHDAPPFMVTAGARALTVVLIAACFVTIKKDNYFIFAIGAFLFGLGAIVLIGYFNHQRHIHIHRVPKVNGDGLQARDVHGGPLFDQLVIGREADMNGEAKKALNAARRARGGLSLTDFMAGYGATSVNNPTALWSREQLAGISNRMTITLMGIILCVVMAFYLAASIVEIHQRPLQPIAPGVGGVTHKYQLGLSVAI